MSRNSGKKKSKKGELTFRDKVNQSMKVMADNNLPLEKRQENRFKKLEGFFETLGNKSNRYIFYCPDMPFATTMQKTIYNFAYHLTQLGYSTQVLHEVKGYKPTWFTSENENWVKEIKVDYLSEKDGKGGFTKPAYVFVPTDTIIIPDGFWTVMKGFSQIKALNKVVLVFGYGGISTMGDDEASSWSQLGFNKAICVSERIKEDYEKLYPTMKYFVVPFIVDQEEFKPKPVEEIYPSIALSCRSREDSASICNIFYNRYPFLDMFQFKVMKQLDTASYIDVLSHCCVLVSVDEKAGCPAPPLEALACNIPCIAVYGRGMEHILEAPNMIWVKENDNFVIAEELADICYNWLNNITPYDMDKKVLENFSIESVKKQLSVAINGIQEDLVTTFSAIKQATEEGKLDKAYNEVPVVVEELVAVEEPGKDEPVVVENPSVNSLKAV